ncbi:MAG: redoxin domain-containing protein [Bacteroidales bacterium]|nr:redoxin domain-containing protein [Bacteroidales bacterium]
MYNYPKFKNKEYDLLHSTGIRSGEIIPNFTVVNLDGKTKSISDFLDKPIVLETGSLSCGMFAGQEKAMNQLAKEVTDFNFLLLYVREAHPGKSIQAHSSMHEKCDLANRLNSEDKIENRTIIIDDINGTVHKILGALPNMVFIIDTNRLVIFKDEWNNASDLQKAMHEFRITQKPIRQKWSMLPLPNIPVEYKVFKRAGWDAGFDFIVALPKLLFSHLFGGLCRKFPGFC